MATAVGAGAGAGAGPGAASAASSPTIKEDTLLAEIRSDFESVKRRVKKGEAPIVFQKELKFTFDGKEYSTVFLFRTRNGMNNGCVRIVADTSSYIPPEMYYDSFIQSNSSEKMCFTPMLTDGLPPGVSQTDLLQVLTTKLKFAISGLDTVYVQDAAKIKHHAIPISSWRLLRGERTLYEKYGYSSPIVDAYRQKVKETKWSAIKNGEILIDDAVKTLEVFWSTCYPDKYADDNMSVSDVMKMLSYEDTEASIVVDDMSHRKESIVTFVFALMKELAGAGQLTWPLTLMVHKDNEPWKSWNSRLLFTSYTEIKTSPSSATRRRKIRRRHTRRRR
jgi:hypothetical protein